MMKSSIKVLSLIFIISLFGCKNDQNKMEEVMVGSSVTTFYLIRHAEKDRTDPENVDPVLSQNGLGRAMHWAEILNDVKLDEIYTTDFERTKMTAAPTSVKKDITVTYYDPKSIDIDQFKSDNLNKNVLVVGHSNTIPEMVNKIIGEDKYPDMEDSDNGSLFIVQIVNGIPTDTHLIFNCNCPAGR